MNPQFNYTHYTTPIISPVVKPPLQVSLQDILNGGKTSGADLAVDPLAEVQKTLTDNLPNYVIGGVGLFMILLGIGAVALPVAKEIV